MNKNIKETFIENDFIIISSSSQNMDYFAYLVVGTLPFFFLLWFIFLFFPVSNPRNSNLGSPSTIDYKDYNTVSFLNTRVIGLIASLIGCAVIYSVLFRCYPCVLILPEGPCLIFDPLVYYTFMFLIVCYLLLSQLIYRYKKDLKKEELIYFVFFIFSSLAILFQYNLIGIFLCLELFSLSSYLLVAGLGRKVSIEGAIKYSLIGLLGTVFFIMGITFCILNYGTLSLYELSYLIRYEMVDLEIKDSLDGLKYSSLCGIFFLISIFIKLGVAPFHFWIIDVYKGVSPVTFIWLITISKVVLIYILILILNSLLPFACFYYSNIFLGLSVLSIIIGSLGGLRQVNLKGLLAYSSIVTVGFVLLPFVSFFDQPRIAITLALSYLVVYMFNLFSFFFFFSKLEDQYLIFNNFYKLSNIVNSNPVLSIGLVVSLFSFMGLPPLLGFFPKIFILNNLVSEGYYITVAICIICTLFTSFYYFLLIKKLCFSKTWTYLNYKQFTIIDYIIIFFFIFVNLFFFLFYDQLVCFISILV